MPRSNSNTLKRNIANDGLGGYFGQGAGSAGAKRYAGQALWASIDSTYIIACINAADAVGVALLFGSNRDKSALALGVFRDGAKNTFYFNAGDDWEAGVQAWLWEFTEKCLEAAEAPKGGK